VGGVHLSKGVLGGIGSIVELELAQVRRMRILYGIVALTMLLILISSVSAAAAEPRNSWTSLEANGGLCKAKGNYLQAASLFGEAAALAEKEQLPIKYREIALCRETEAEVLANKILVAEPHLKELLTLVKAHKCCPVESDLAVWMVDLAKTYQEYPNPGMRLGCLGRACYICELTYGRNRKGFWDAMSRLADYYLDQGQNEKAVSVLAAVVSEEEKRFGKNPSALGDTVYQLAIKRRTEHKYQQAKQLGMVVIKMAQSSSSTLRAGLPAFFSLLGINSCAEGSSAEGQEYFNEAKKQWLAIKGPSEKERTKQRLALRQYFAPLLEAVWADRLENKLALAETEYQQLLSLEQAIFSNPLELYGVYTRLSSILELEGKLPEAEKCLAHCISLGKLPNSFVKNFLAEFYMRLGVCQSCQHRQKEANDSFAKSIEAESDQHSFHAAGVWKAWACCLRDSGQTSLAIQRLEMALKIARELPPEKRSDLLVDALQTGSEIETKLGKLKEAEALHQQSLAEAKVQQSLESRRTRNKYGGYD
jgi:hypothetical protein